MNSTQHTAAPLYSWIKGVGLTELEWGQVVKFHDQNDNWIDRHSFAFTPEGRYLQIYRDL